MNLSSRHASTWLFCLAVISLNTVLQGPSTWDEGWFLQIANRIATGDVPYRDIFLGVTPLSLYATAGIVTIFGAEVLAVKAVVAISHFASVFLTCRIGRQLGLGQGLPLTLLLALLVFDGPWQGAPYTPMAEAFFLVCFSAILAWRERVLAANTCSNDTSEAILLVVISGIAAGLSFSAKQNMGLFALATAFSSIVIVSRNNGDSRRKTAHTIAVLWSSFFLTSFIVLLPVWLSDGLPNLITYGFVNKSTYVRHGGISYWDMLGQLSLSFYIPKSIEDLIQLKWRFVFLLPPLTFLGLLVIWLRRDGRKLGLTAIVLLFVGFSFAQIFPRSDSVHLSYILPQVLLGLAYVWRQLAPVTDSPPLRLAHLGFVAFLALGVTAMTLRPVSMIASTSYRLSQSPHLRGLLVHENIEAQILDNARNLAEAANGETLFILSPQAGFYYLMAGLKNPTPFDFPLATPFGPGGQEKVIEAINQREISAVCMEPLGADPLSPALLEQYVQANMRRRSNLGLCTLYVNPE